MDAVLKYWYNIFVSFGKEKMIDLTRRQQEVLSKFLDIYHEGGGPVHYGMLAKHLGVGQVSAYEMLRLLEKHGLVKAEYQRPEEASGPGRSIVVFRPTLSATRRLRLLAGGDFRDQREWKNVKARILDQLQNYQDKDYESLLDELLERIPDQHVSFSHLAEIATAILVNLNILEAKEEVANLQSAFSKKGSSGVVGLSALIGVGTSFAISKRLYCRLGRLLLSKAGQILATIATLDSERLNRLSGLLRDVARSL